MFRSMKLLVDQNGNAMLISLLVMLVLTALGMGFAMQSKLETQIAGNDSRWSQSLFVAEAGVSEVLGRMRDDADTANYIGEAPGSETPGWATYLVSSNGGSSYDPEIDDFATDGYDNNLNGYVDETDEKPIEVMTKQTGQNQMEYPWVKAEYLLQGGQIVRYGDHDDDVTTQQQYNFVAGAPVLVITAQGNRGNAQRIIEVEAVKANPDIVNAAVYTEDDQFQFNGLQFEISGEDHDPYTGVPIPGSTEVPAIATTEDPANIAGALSGAQINNVVGEGVEPSVTTSPIDMDLDALFATYSEVANMTFPSGTYSNVNWGDIDNYNVVKIEGDLHTSGNVSGGGILLIDGNYTSSGSFSWYGLVLILGDMNYTGGGAGIHIYGSTLVEGNVSQQVVSGNADLYYSSEALRRLATLLKYQTISWIEL